MRGNHTKTRPAKSIIFPCVSSTMQRHEKLVVNGREIALRIRIERREQASASIGKMGISIRIPLGMNREEQFRAIIDMKKWAIEQIRKKPLPQAGDEYRSYSDGEILSVGPEKFILHIVFSNKQSSSARNVGDAIHLDISQHLDEAKRKKHVSTLLSRIVAARRLPALKERISSLNQAHFKSKMRKIFFKHQKSSWGSCSSLGNINISTRLLFAPDEVLDYVCIHELAHLTHHNHSDAFWNLVRSAMPDFEKHESWLDTNGKECRF